MSLYSQHDSLPLPLNNLYYDTSKRLTDPFPRLLDDSNNFYTTYKNSISTRPGFEKVASSITPSGYQPQRMWVYESPYATYIFSSMVNLSNFKCNLYYINLSAVSPAWTQVSTLRGVHETDILGHQCVSFKNKLYVKFMAYDTTTYGKYGAVIVYEDGTGLHCVPWGVPKPTVPARIKGVTSKITSGTVTTGATAFTIADATGMPATPFSLWVGLEEMTVTAKAGVAPSTLTVTRAVNGTSAESYATGTRVYWKNFAASDNLVNVDRGWRYSYGWKSITGHVSSAAPVEFNPDLMPSETGRFKNLKPKVIVQGHADTTNFPKVVIYRTPNGGGNLFVCDEITNTGAGDIEYEDKNQASGPTSSVFNDPILDGKLTVLAPDDTSNDPPPAINAPGITGGLGVPETTITDLVIYANRIWFAIYNILYYSSNEELDSGVPEEAFDSSVLKGNFIVFEHNIMQIQTSQDGLLIKTRKDTHIITGTTKDTFVPQILVPKIGGVGPLNPRSTVYSNSKSACKISNGDAWVDSTGNIVIRHNGSKEAVVISKTFISISPLASPHLLYYKDFKYEWLLVILADTATPTINNLHIFDLKHYEATGRNPNISSWYPPWKGFNPIAMLTDTIAIANAAEADIYLILMSWNVTANRGQLVYMKFDISYDNLLNNSAVPTNTNFTSKLKTNYLMPVTGNHFNELIVSSIYVPFKTLLVEKVYQGSADSEVVKYSSDFGTLTTASNSGSSLVKAQPNTTNLINLYKYDIDVASRRMQFELSYSADGKKVDIENLIPIWRAVSNVSSD